MMRGLSDEHVKEIKDGHHPKVAVVLEYMGLDAQKESDVFHALKVMCNAAHELAEDVEKLTDDNKCLKDENKQHKDDITCLKKIIEALRKKAQKEKDLWVQQEARHEVKLALLQQSKDKSKRPVQHDTTKTKAKRQLEEKGGYKKIKTVGSLK